MLRVLVTTNNFWVGGRETYVATYLRALFADGIRADLITEQLQEGVPEREVFDRVVLCGAPRRPGTLPTWIREGQALIAARRPAVIWAQHYALLPAWILSRITRTPLVTTFHGPLVGAARPNALLEALGMTLATYRGDRVVTVSSEASQSIATLPGQHASGVLPNAVPTLRTFERRPPRSLLLVARQAKLDHIRQAVLLFAEYSKLTPGVRLAVIAADDPRNRGISGLLASVRYSMTALGVNWCVTHRATLGPSLAYVRWLGYAPDPRALMRAHDAVLGMGRVVIEGLAEGKPAVLIGYDRICGVVTDQRMQVFSSSNFSGRNVPPLSPAQAAVELLALSDGSAPPNTSSLDVARWAPTARDLLQGARYEASEHDERLARDLAAFLMEPEPREDGLFQRAVSRLSAHEAGALYQIAEG